MPNAISYQRRSLLHLEKRNPPAIHSSTLFALSNHGETAAISRERQREGGALRGCCGWLLCVGCVRLSHYICWWCCAAGYLVKSQVDIVILYPKD